MVYRKYDGSLHWNCTMRWLGEDAHGQWLGVPAMSEARRGHEPPVTFREPYVQLFPAAARWTALFNAAPARTEVYCDITTVPRWRDDEVTMVDLDLDVIRQRPDGETFVDDEDEFAAHQVRYAYPPDVVAGAEEACRWLFKAVSTRAEPFDRVAATWLARIGEG